MRVTFGPAAAGSVPMLGRTHPIIASYCDAVLGEAMGLDPDGRFPRCGTIITDAVSRRTAVLLLRLRYLLREATEQFAEEIAVAAFERRDGAIGWLEPLESQGRDLMESAQPTANLTSAERQAEVRWALSLLQAQGDWFEPLVAARVETLTQAQRRVRRLVNAAPLSVMAHTPPDILGCYVLVPAGGRRG